MSVLLTAEQTADRLSISYSYFRHLLAKDPTRIPPFVTIGKRRRWRPETIDRWFEESEKSQARLS